MKTWSAYILLCNDASYYTGCTNNIEDRLKRHYKRYIPYTRDRLPIRLITRIEFYDKYKACHFERYLKSGSGKAFMKRHLI